MVRLVIPAHQERTYFQSHNDVGMADRAAKPMHKANNSNLYARTIEVPAGRQTSPLLA